MNPKSELKENETAKIEAMAEERTKISKKANAVSSVLMGLWNYVMQIFILLSVERENVLYIRAASFPLGLLGKKMWEGSRYFTVYANIL